MTIPSTFKSKLKWHKNKILFTLSEIMGRRANSKIHNIKYFVVVMSIRANIRPNDGCKMKFNFTLWKIQIVNSGEKSRCSFRFRDNNNSNSTQWVQTYYFFELLTVKCITKLCIRNADLVIHSRRVSMLLTISWFVKCIWQTFFPFIFYKNICISFIVPIYMKKKRWQCFPFSTRNGFDGTDFSYCSHFIYQNHLNPNSMAKLVFEMHILIFAL